MQCGTEIAQAAEADTLRDLLPAWMLESFALETYAMVDGSRVEVQPHGFFSLIGSDTPAYFVDKYLHSDS